MFTPDELKNLEVLISVGAKAISAEKPLSESAAIQNVALAQLQKIQNLSKDEPKVE